MKGLRFVFALCLVFLTVVIGNQKIAVSGEERKLNNILKVTNVAEAFYQEGIQLNLSQEHSSDDFSIGGKLPVVYDFPESGEKLFIYEFSSVDKVYEAINKITKEGTLKDISGFDELLKGV